MRSLLRAVILVFLAVAFLMALGWLLPPADGQCLPGQPCPTWPTPNRGWRAARPVLPKVVARPTANPAIVRVGYRKANVTDYGSGTIIDRRGKYAYVLTAWHTFRDHWPAGKSFVWTARKGSYWARIEQVDRSADLVVLKIADPGIQPIALAISDGKSGESVRTGGYGGGQFELTTGRVQSINSQGVLICSGRNRSGDSGGPVLNSRGQLIGVAWGSDGRICTAAPLGPIRRILRCVLPPYPNRPGLIVPKPIVVMPTPSPQPTPAPPPVSVTTAVIDYDELAEAILAKIDLATLQGPAGDVGPQGPPGEINYDKLATAVLKQINLADLRGPIGPIGPIGPEGPPGEVSKSTATGSMIIEIEPLPPVPER